MHALTAVVALLAASPALAQPAVSLLTDFSGYPKSGTVNLRSVLSKVAERKGAPFRFGSTYDTSHPNQSWLTNVFNTVFNHVVAENGCKWQSTEQTRGQPSLTACKGVQSFASSRGASFRGHNTFWHAQTPSWLPGSFSCSDLVNSIIPTNVKNTISGLGSSVTSWDVTNEIVGDGVSNGMSAFQCISNKNVWPTSGNKCTNTDFARAAFKQALATASSNTRLVLNDYNTGGNDAKTACQFAVLADIVASGVPYNRTSIGFQTHQSTSGFYSKAALKANLQKLQGLGAHGLLTEIDIAVSSTASNQLRYQAAIWGDYLDACLYASNCFEFINWNPRDDMSWLGSGKSGTLHDSSGNPKLVLYELWARFTRYANGEAELCATALGTGSCQASGPGGSTNPPTSTSNIITTTSTNGGTCAALYGQCGGDGYTGPTCCAQGTCKYSNQWYSQCLN